jgi:hypothetical protein
VVRRPLERTDREAEPGEVAVDVQRHLVRIVAVHIRPAGEEPPFLVHCLPVEAHRRDRGAVHVVEVRAVWPVLGDDLRMHRLVLGTTRKLRVRPVIRVRVGVELPEFVKQVGQLPLRFLAVGLVPREHAAVLLPDREDPQPQRSARSVRLIGDVAVGAVRTPSPAVKRALDAVADHLATVSDVSTEVPAVAREDVQLT